MTVTLSYESGTIRIDADDEDPTALPGVEADPRSETGRASAFRYPELRALLDERGVVVDDRVLDLPSLDLSSDYRLRGYQREALDAWRQNGDRGVLELPTGSGKTVIGLAAMEALAVPTLVVVPTIDLLDQWRRELDAEFGGPIGTPNSASSSRRH